MPWRPWCHTTLYRPSEMTQISKLVSVDPPGPRDINSKIVWSTPDAVEIPQIVLCDATIPYNPLPTFSIDQDNVNGIGWSSWTFRHQLQDSLGCPRYFKILNIVLCDAVMSYDPLQTFKVYPSIIFGIGWSSIALRYQLQDSLEYPRYCTYKTKYLL